jgi:AraC-like DNA-binding protein
MKSITIRFRGRDRKLLISSHNRWLQILLVGFILIWIVNLNSFAIYMIVRRPGWCAYTASIYALSVFLFINTIMFFLLLKPDVYYIIEKYKNNKLGGQDKVEYLQKLSAYMETHKPFLNPDITLESLANEISVNPRILSQIVNETYNKNFKSYILEFRVKESMRMLEDSKYKKHTVLEILYEVGFNSKSAFNNQFKLYTNLTPQEYRSQFVN